MEEGQVFYSADPSDPNVVWAQATMPNRTIIRYKASWPEITRCIFLLPQEMALWQPGQSITVANHGAKSRRIKLVVTGMFGPAQAGALERDVLYTI